jgi:hypothetical protein
MKKLLIVPLLALLMGCASFDTNAFRTEQTALNLAYGAYVGWTNYLATADPQPSPQVVAVVKEARLKFAASLSVVDALRVSYATNSAVQPALNSALTTLTDQSSNLVWLATYLKGK